MRSVKRLDGVSQTPHSQHVPVVKPTVAWRTAKAVALRDVGRTCKVKLNASSSDRCFALETMSEDGQAWVMDELGQKLVGLAHRTPRVTCRTTELRSYRGDLADGDKALRCDRLDLDLGWEATSRAAEGKKFTGKAKVTMCSKDHHDLVDVEVQVDPDCLAGLPRERDQDRVVADVVYAVESLDTAIMEQLNDFLWSMEHHNVHPHPAHQEVEAGGSGEGEWGRRI